MIASSLVLWVTVARISVLAPGADLQRAINKAAIGDTIRLRRGIYTASPRPYRERLCGNCVDPRTEVQATVGFHVKGKPLVIIGEGTDRTTLLTGAGYGVLFEGSSGSQIKGLTVTGGRRDPDGRATDAGIVVKNGRVTIENVRISDNTDRVDSVVVGIGGVFGREQGELFILDNIISNNGWDGVALYRGSTAVIADNVIERGRGAGIGLTWDASALVYRNRVSGYWKGIGTFGESRATVKNNAVHDNLGWGIIATGNSYLEATNNVVYHNGNCGFAAWEETARGILRNNIIAKNGWKDEWVCPRVGVWMNARPEDFPIRYNDVWGNECGECLGTDSLAGVNGNISQEPLFEEGPSFGQKWGQAPATKTHPDSFRSQSPFLFRLRKSSPCIDSGDPGLVDTDGTRSDMGMYGGPLARR
jgi:hypothetical protein